MAKKRKAAADAPEQRAPKEPKEKGKSGGNYQGVSSVVVKTATRVARSQVRSATTVYVLRA